jgi:PadR family transcriptional regulator, regulatory protein AphA
MTPPPLTPTSRVILAMIASGNQTGYDIKQMVDKAIRHFWAASYGQIYPELRRLEEHGLIESEPQPRGGRARTVYHLTPAGDAALADWIEPAPDPTFEVRDEGMLRLFFSDFGSPEQRIENLRAMRDVHRRTLAQLAQIEGKTGPIVRTGPRLTHDLGVSMHTWMAEWCETAIERLQDEIESSRSHD